MKITIPYRYLAAVIPPRCRKPRDTNMEASIRLNIRETTGAEAPIAIIEHDSDFKGAKRVPVERQYRWFRGKLYGHTTFRRACHAPYETQTAEQFAVDPYPLSVTTPSGDGCFRDQAEQIADLRSWAASILFIDGERWEVMEEPRYVVMTYGLGHNHGLGCGTDLSVAYSYNSNISRDRYFRIDQFEKAVAETTRVALARGDTKAVPVLSKQKVARFEILISEAIRLKPRRQHGKGHVFMNSVESIIEDSATPGEAAILVLAHAVSGNRTANR